ncbi:hypothetical protein [Haloglomus litoreum]|uniref:hypothetical protein n=1 Tax=Haloglomus litoreum TaxID=3034026 RepID=UPI0023E7ABE0|nr:hypothetical protein [Haloglomus sp. DT116]
MNLHSAASTALLQMGPNIDGGFTTPGVGDVVSSAIGAFITTLVVGAILVAVAPGYVERMMDTLVDEPVGSFVYGLVCLLGLVLVVFVLFITIIGILVAIPLAIIAGIAWAVGAAIAYLVIAERLVGREGDEWAKPLLVAAALNGALTLTGIGGLVAFGIGAAGFGAVLRDRLG